MLAAFSISIGELAATILVLPPGVNTLPITIFGLIHYGVDDQVAGICLVLVGLFTAISIVAVWLMNTRDES
jgi:iron(III) transport system permease protein